MAQATSSRGGISKTQAQVESNDSPDSESAKNHPEATKGTESQNGIQEVSSREKRRHRASLARHSRLPREDHSVVLEGRRHRASLARHARKCSVCHHKDREFIDADYLRWISPETLARQYKISHHSVVYRHADATGLRTQRRAALRATLEHFIEQAENVRVTAHSVVAAVRLYSQINDQGQYTPTPRRHIIEHRYVGLPAEDGLPAEAGTEPPSVSRAATAAAAKQETKGGSPPNTFAATCAAPPAQAQNNSGPVQTTGSSSPVASTAAPSAAPLSESPEKFPAVSVAAAPAPTKSKTTATPIATIYLQTNAISNRELLGLEHAATH
jgi:hypothetical protein